MIIGVLGTGVVGRTLAGKLATSGHTVVLGTRSVQKTLARTQPDQFGQLPISEWLEGKTGLTLGTYADASRQAEAVLNATNGMGTLEALHQSGEENLNEKILMDISNPLDFSQGMPPFLSVSNTDSLGEQVQSAFPHVKVVKTLNTLTAALIVNPGQLADGDHTIFVSGNDMQAKAQVTGWLAEWFGWKHIIDLGDITTARGVEMYLPLWLRLWNSLGTGMIKIKVVR